MFIKLNEHPFISRVCHFGAPSDVAGGLSVATTWLALLPAESAVRGCAVDAARLVNGSSGGSSGGKEQERSRRQSHRRASSDFGSFFYFLLALLFSPTHRAASREPPGATRSGGRRV